MEEVQLLQGDKDNWKLKPQSKCDHHFYDEDTSELLDIKQEDISLSKLPDAPNGKKVRGIEVIIKVASGNHMQKKIN